MLSGMDTTAKGSSIDLAVRGHRVDIVLTPHLPIQGEPVGGRWGLLPYRTLFVSQEPSRWRRCAESAETS
jgi:hypothetical protein